MIELHESIQAVVKETKPVWTSLVCINFYFCIFQNVTAEKLESTQLPWEEGFLDHCSMFHFDSKASELI